MLCYSKRYFRLLSDVKGIALISQSNRNNVIDPLTALSKFMGQYEQFKSSLKNYDIKKHKTNSIESFRILSASNSDILDWYGKAHNAVRDNEKLYLELMMVTGVRCTEGILAFNKIIELAGNGKTCRILRC